MDDMLNMIVGLRIYVRTFSSEQVRYIEKGLGCLSIVEFFKSRTESTYIKYEKEKFLILWSTRKAVYGFYSGNPTTPQ